MNTPSLTFSDTAALWVKGSKLQQAEEPPKVWAKHWGTAPRSHVCADRPGGALPSPQPHSGQHCPSGIQLPWKKVMLPCVPRPFGEPPLSCWCPQVPIAHSLAILWPVSHTGMGSKSSTGDQLTTVGSCLYAGFAGATSALKYVSVSVALRVVLNLRQSW